ncbi:hypothetical protein CNR22_15880 [Sphingobacteriaceae bacterium]|nr:hypothetical protein CNR22_15880 [Sphingobacteriaceae bacterium]
MKDVDKREHILLKAEELFSKNGFNETSTRMLAAAAKVNLGMLTYYFGTKDKILQALIDRKLGFFRDSFAVIDKLDLPTIKKVDAIIDVYVDHMFEHRRFHRILHSEVLSEKHSDLLDYAYALIKKNHEFLSEIVEKGKKEKEFKNIDSRLFMASITGTLTLLIKTETVGIFWLSSDSKASSLDDPAFKKHVKTFLKEMAHGYLIAKTN